MNISSSILAFSNKWIFSRHNKQQYQTAEQQPDCAEAPINTDFFSVLAALFKLLSIFFNLFSLWCCYCCRYVYICCCVVVYICSAPALKIVSRCRKSTATCLFLCNFLLALLLDSIRFVFAAFSHTQTLYIVNDCVDECME